MTLWTEARIDELQTRYATGVSASVIGDAMGLTRNAIIGKCNRLGLRRETKGKIAEPGRHNRQSERRIIHKIVRAGYEGGYRIATTSECVAPVLHCVEIESLNLTLAELDQATQCHYIAGNDHLYCGHPVKPGSSFCPHHHARCWQPAKPPTAKARMWQPDFSRGAA